MAMVEVMGENNLKLFIAEYEDRIIAANIVMFFGNRAVYLHGASSNECRNLMAPYLLQWEQIKEAKKQGCEIYDFWGIDEKKWPGVTRFKKGFGGEEIDYSGTFDFIFDKTWYEIYKIAKRII
jgi:lipid II:glycine glycyltransferase (peptidoglycan interpeptide bridge formation enzyme)